MLTTLNKIDLINLIYEQIDLFASFKKSIFLDLSYTVMKI